MKNFVPAKLGAFCIPVLMLAGTGCSTISRFDQYSYAQATSLKVDAVNLMATATQPFDNHLDEVNKVKTAIDKMYEYEKNRPKNVISEKMWLVVRDSSGHSFGGFIKRWQAEKTLDPAFIKESQQLVSESFDQISQLESGKIKQVAN
ncbi:hypothetical protein FEM33_17270 [Dyadobacter flavalbus]|uniref:Uncharacterized protein n=1 Tax=Dyadobacter flavalbus TaxID=2579942 RepID=A0A5M8QQC0_9BACT|nr:hypothetical protein [Dyadobacter flavalbus]KAA6438437.1 hypothetical protein FEM33_17270 [Dyadobacter flavalbus]